MMGKEQADYLSYLLRIWRVDEVSDGRGCAVWRASLESTHTGEQRSFASLGYLLDFLQRQTNMSVGTEGQE